jgi:hypothetical protein
MVTGVCPNLSQLYVIRSRGFVLNTHLPRRDKLKDHTLEGFLLGYDASSIYRVWLSNTNCVIRCKRLDLCWPQWVHFGSQEHHRTSWNSMESHGTSWNPTEPHGIPRNLMESHGTSWNPTEPHGISQNLMEFHGTSWNSMEGSGTWQNLLVADK